MKIKGKRQRGKRGSAQLERRPEREKGRRGSRKDQEAFNRARCHRGPIHRLALREPGRGPVSIETLQRLQEEQDTEVYSH